MICLYIETMLLSCCAPQPHMLVHRDLCLHGRSRSDLAAANQDLRPESRCAQGAGGAKASGDEAAEYTVVRDGVASAADTATAGKEDEANVGGEAADAEGGAAAVIAGQTDVSGVQLDSAGGDSHTVTVSSGEASSEEQTATQPPTGTVSCQRWTPAGCSLVAGEVRRSSSCRMRIVTFN